MQSIDLSNGHKIPLLGLGTWQVSDRHELEKAMNYAFDAGYRYFDTAYNYNNEHIIGDVIKSWIENGKVKREELFIASKLPGPGMHESRVEHFLKLSLAALKLDYVDLYMFHTPVGLKYVDDDTNFPTDGDNLALDMDTDLVKIWKAMESQVLKGRVRALGVSNVNEEQVERIFAAAEIKPANIQAEANVYFQQKSLRATCKKLGITYCAYSPLASPGRGKFYEKMGVSGFIDPRVLNDPVVNAIAKDYGKTAAQIVLRFLVQQDVTVIPKSTNKERIFENAQIFDFKLSSDEMTKLEKLDKNAERKMDFFVLKGGDKHPEFPNL